MTERLVPILRVERAHEVAAWYARLGFEVIAEHQFEPGFPYYLFLRRNDVHLHLSEHSGDAPHASLVYLYVDDVDAVAVEFGVPVASQPWGREIELADPCGNRWRLGTVPDQPA